MHGLETIKRMNSPEAMKEIEKHNIEHDKTIATVVSLNGLMRYCLDTDGKKFAMDVYGKDWDVEYTYLNEKYYQFRQNTIFWMASLDSQSMNHLARAINKHMEDK